MIKSIIFSIVASFVIVYVYPFFWKVVKTAKEIRDERGEWESVITPEEILKRMKENERKRAKELS